MERKIFFNDLKPGDTLAAGGFEVTRDDIIRFARRYDPRPYHTDEDSARSSIFGGLVASGAQTLAIWNSLRFQAENGLAQLATLSLDGVHYNAPVRPDDCLRLEAEVVSCQRSLRKPDRGVVKFQHGLINQDDVRVMDAEVNLLVAKDTPNDWVF